MKFIRKHKTTIARVIAFLLVIAMIVPIFMTTI